MTVIDAAGAVAIRIRGRAAARLGNNMDQVNEAKVTPEAICPGCGRKVRALEGEMNRADLKAFRVGKRPVYAAHARCPINAGRR